MSWTIWAITILGGKGNWHHWANKVALLPVWLFSVIWSKCTIGSVHLYLLVYCLPRCTVPRIGDRMTIDTFCVDYSVLDRGELPLAVDSICKNIMVAWSWCSSALSLALSKHRSWWQGSFLGCFRGFIDLDFDVMLQRQFSTDSSVVVKNGLPSSPWLFFFWKLLFFLFVQVFEEPLSPLKDANPKIWT